MVWQTIAQNDMLSHVLCVQRQYRQATCATDNIRFHCMFNLFVIVTADTRSNKHAQIQQYMLTVCAQQLTQKKRIMLTKQMSRYSSLSYVVRCNPPCSAGKWTNFKLPTCLKLVFLTMCMCMHMCLIHVAQTWMFCLAQLYMHMHRCALMSEVMHK